VFREEWREDIFYYLVSSLLIQVLTYLTLAPSNFVIENQDLGVVRAWVRALPWIVQLGAIMLLTRPSANGSLEFGFSSWNARGHYFGIFGAAQPEPGGWRFRQDMNSADPKQRCEAIIARLPDGGYSFSVTPAGQCESSGGYGAAPLPNDKFLFPARAREGTMPPLRPASLQVRCRM